MSISIFIELWTYCIYTEFEKLHLKIHILDLKNCLPADQEPG